jgi:exopolysaccharide biosynthesis polyprenyl glycosylphosphotransferase
LRGVSQSKQWRLYILSLIFVDFIMISFASQLAYWVRFALDIPLFVQDVTPSLEYYRSVSLTLTLILIIAYAVGGLYDRQNLLGGIHEYSRLFRATTTGILLVVIAGFLEPEMILARGWLLLAWVLIFLLTAGGRFALRRVVYSLRRQGLFLTPAIVIGANDEGRSLAIQLQRWHTSGLQVLGFADDEAAAGSELPPMGNGLPVLGPISELEQIVEQYRVQEIIVATSALSRLEMLRIFRQYGMDERVNLRLSSGLFEIITTGLQVKEVAYVPLVHVNKVRLTGVDRTLKFLLDYAIAIPALIFLAPVLGLIALAIKLDSPGPAVYRRRVMGVNGKQFDAYKFRTMHINGDDILAQYPELRRQLARDHKLKWDPRVTRMGETLRKLSLDELPQLFNVLRRQMSLVGPRMVAPEEMEKYDKWGMNLLTVLPGITGLWQVSGRSDLSYEERVRLDMQYVRNWSIWLDLQIVLQTISVVWSRKGAY